MHLASGSASATGAALPCTKVASTESTEQLFAPTSTLITNRFTSIASYGTLAPLSRAARVAPAHETVHFGGAGGAAFFCATAVAGTTRASIARIAGTTRVFMGPPFDYSALMFADFTTL